MWSQNEKIKYLCSKVPAKAIINLRNNQHLSNRDIISPPSSVWEVFGYMKTLILIICKLNTNLWEGENLSKEGKKTVVNIWYSWWSHILRHDHIKLSHQLLITIPVHVGCYAHQLAVLWASRSLETLIFEKQHKKWRKKNVKLKNYERTCRYVWWVDEVMKRLVIFFVFILILTVTGRLRTQEMRSKNKNISEFYLPNEIIDLLTQIHFRRAKRQKSEINFEFRPISLFVYFLFALFHVAVFCTITRRRQEGAAKKR